MVGWMDEILVDTHYSDSPKRSKYTAYFENTEEQGEGHGGFWELGMSVMDLKYTNRSTEAKRTQRGEAAWQPCAGHHTGLREG